MVRDRDAKHRRLAAIVFTDIVGFSALVNRDETLGARSLDLQRRIVRRLVPAFGGREIETAGDSFLLEFTSTFAALRCVVAIQQTLKREPPAMTGDPPVRLRASIHLGDVEHRGREVFGDGVNIAARLMPMSPEGGIAISDQVHSQIRHRLEVAARSIGPCELKNIRYPVEVFLLDATAVSAIPVEIATAAPAPARSQQPLLRLAAAAVLVLGVLGAGVLAAQTWMHPAESATPSHRRIAVLPFASFSNGENDDLLASGLQDSILTNLARVSDLRITSRTSVRAYKDQATRKLKTIASELGVDAIIEGSLQRNGQRMLVQVQLIDAETDQHLWAQSYDRDIADLFAVESAVAQEVAAAVRGTLSEPQRALVNLPPTASIEAYTEYQRALQIDNGDYERLSEVQNAVTRALALDPSFALAHLEQARLHLLNYYANFDRSEARLGLVRQELIRAGELRPDLPELHRGWGNYYLYCRRDLQAARAEFDAVLQRLPNDADTLRSIGEIALQQDHLGEALTNQRRAVEVDPRSFESLLSLKSTLELMRDYDGARRALDAAAKIEPGSPVIPILRAQLLITANGDLDGAKALMKQIDYAPALEKLDYLMGDVDGAMAQLQRQPEWQGSAHGAAAYPVEAALAYYLWLKGEHEQARPHFQRAADLLEKVLQLPDAAQWEQKTTLALSYAALGKKAEASELIEQVRHEDCCDNPVTRADILEGIAVAELVLGNHGAAIDALEQGLREPTRLSWHLVDLNPAWKDLREVPRFQQMISRARESLDTLHARN